MEEAYNQGTFDPTEVDSIQPRADRIWKACILDALETGDTDNVTGLLTNPNFTGNTNGWTYEKLGGPNNDGLKYGNNVAECYEQAFDVYQEVNGLPAGTYEVSVQGFYRPAGNATWSAAWGVEGDATNDVLAYVYGTTGMAKLPHVADGLQDETSVEDCAQLTAGGADLEGKYVCNGKKSAELIMADGTSYLMTVKCYVGEDGNCVSV